MTETAAPPTDHQPALAPRELIDRHGERAALEGALAGARAGEGGALVVRGAPGIGRTVLLDYAMDNARGMRVARLSGIESEMGLGFAALHRVLLPWTAHLDRLPGPQRDALSAVFGLVTADSPNRFMVGLATLALLTDVAADEPLLVAIDDAQWLDQATAEVLGFVARRLAAVPVLLVIAVREPTNRCQPFDGLPELHLTGLPEQDAHRLLAQVVTGPLDPRTAARIVADTAGNPLALVEFGRQLTGDEPAQALPQPMPISGQLTGQFQRWIRTLPAGTQTLLLLAAAEPASSPAMLRRAADLLGLGPGAAQSAEAAGLLTYADPVTFRQPLVRSAVYHGAAPRDRRRVHRALASVAGTDPDRRAWHLAAATSEPDEEIADELAEAASRARAHGDHAAEGMLLARAAELTPDQARRADRLIDAAAAELAAGAPGRAEALLDQAAPMPASALAGARTIQLRATMSLTRGRFSDAAPALLNAARELNPTDPRLARRTLLDALYAALVAGPPASATAMLDVVHTARSWRPEAPHTVEDHLLDGFTTRLTLGHRAAVPALRTAVTLLLAEPDEDLPPRLLALGCWAAGELLDSAALRALTDRWADAAGVTDQGDPTMADPDVAGVDPAGTPGSAGVLGLAWRGDDDEAQTAIAGQLLGATDRGAGLAAAAARHATGVLDLGLGRYAAAMSATLAVYHDDPPHLGTHVLPDLVEAAVRCGNRSAARSALQRFTERALAAGTPLALALLDRSRALLAAGAEAENLYRQAIDRLERAGDTAQLARTHLLYGEWLRRQRRRRDAREQLRTARDVFEAAGFHAFAERANGELLATGERTSKRAGVPDGQLTPQEMQVARLVAGGSSNREVAAQLFISPNTVEYHLQKVFRKVGVSSRTQLALALLDPAHRHA